MEPEYRDCVEIAEYFPDLLGHAGTDAEGAGGLPGGAGAANFIFAVRSLLRLGKYVPQAAIDEVAADDEMRNMTYDALKEANAEGRFPKQFRTQEAFARSDMVRWLVYPTELGRAPNEIELMKVAERNTGDGAVAYYLFRFRTTGKYWATKDGWMAGLAGGYLKAEIPTTSSQGDTFSTFEKWDKLKPDEHVDGIVGTIEEAQERKAAQEKEDKEGK